MRLDTVPPSLALRSNPPHIYVTTESLDDDCPIALKSSSHLQPTTPAIPRIYYFLTPPLSVRCFWPLSPIQYL